MNMRSSPKLAAASFFEAWNPSRTSSSFQAMRMPLPPPPAEAFSITGYPIWPEIFTASSASSIRPICPGTVLTPASCAIFFDVILSPIDSMAPAGGPTKATPAFSSASAKALFSDRKP